MRRRHMGWYQSSDQGISGHLVIEVDSGYGNLINVIYMHVAHTSMCPTRRHEHDALSYQPPWITQGKDSTYQEGRIELAIQAFKNGQFKSIRAAAIAYDVPEKTARRPWSNPDSWTSDSPAIHASKELVA